MAARRRSSVASFVEPLNAILAALKRQFPSANVRIGLILKTLAGCKIDKATESISCGRNEIFCTRHKSTGSLYFSLSRNAISCR